MSTITLPYTFVDATTAYAAQVNSCLEAITNVVNGDIDGTNIASTATLSITGLTTTSNATIGGTLTVTGGLSNITTPDTVTITKATGTSPLTVTSTTVCTNLNADKVDGYDLSAGLVEKTRHIYLTAPAAVIPVTSGCGITQTDGTNKSYWTLDFDKDADEFCYFNFPVPENDAANVVFNIWCKSTATSGNVVFVITTADVADAATFDAALGTTITFDAKTVDSSAGDIFVATKTADPGWTAGRLATIKLMRDVSEDSAAADISVVAVEINYEVT